MVVGCYLLTFNVQIQTDIRCCSIPFAISRLLFLPEKSIENSLRNAGLVSIIIHQKNPLSHPHLFGDLNTAGGTEDTLDVTVDGELTSSQGTNHEQTSTDTGVGATEAELLTDLDQTGDGTLTGLTRGLVDLGEHGVGGLGDKGSSETSNETGAKVDSSLGTIAGGVLVDHTVDSLSSLLENDELGHGVGNPEKLLAYDLTLLQLFAA